MIDSGIVRRDDDAAFMRADGSAIPVACAVAPIAVESAVVGAAVACHDIGERKRSAALPQRANAELEARVRERTAAVRSTNAEPESELVARRQSEADVRERETRLRLVIEQAPAVIWATAAEPCHDPAAAPRRQPMPATGR